MVELLLAVNAMVLTACFFALNRIARRPRRFRVDPLEQIATAMLHLARHDNPVQVELPPEVAAGFRQLRRTSVDVQGIIALAARWLVLNLPANVIEDMDPPEHWKVPK